MSCIRVSPTRRENDLYERACNDEDGPHPLCRCWRQTERRTSFRFHIKQIAQNCNNENRRNNV